MGLLMSTVAVASESFPPKSKFTVNDIPDLSDNVIIVTGANCGLGFDTAKVYLLHASFIQMHMPIANTNRLCWNAVPRYTLLRETRRKLLLPSRACVI
jgi:hypothetical protein